MPYVVAFTILLTSGTHINPTKVNNKKKNLFISCYK